LRVFNGEAANRAHHTAEAHAVADIDHSGNSAPVISAASGEPARILVVDDDPVTNRMVVDYLENRNMRATSASGRVEMARMLAVGEPSLVLLDLRLGRDNGFDLLHEIRSRSDVPVIMTADPGSDESDRVVGIELWCR
jgi:two-component system, OmpR family, response regulator